jgi:hypothetical protein
VAELHRPKILPDFYIKIKDPFKNKVTPSQCWWELQPWRRSISDITNHSQLIRDDGEATLTIEAVLRDRGNYMVALLHEDYKESGIIIGMSIMINSYQWLIQNQTFLCA